MNDDLRRAGHARQGLHTPVRVTQQLIYTRNHLMKTAVEIFRGVRMPLVPFTSYAPVLYKRKTAVCTSCCLHAKSVWIAVSLFFHR